MTLLIKVHALFSIKFFFLKVYERHIDYHQHFKSKLESGTNAKKRAKSFFFWIDKKAINMLLVKNYIECYLNSLRALAKITSESFSYEVRNHAETSEEEGEAHDRSYYTFR